MVDEAISYSKTVTIKKVFFFIVSLSGTLKFKPSNPITFYSSVVLFSIFPHFSSPSTLFNLSSSLLCSVPWEFEPLSVSLSSDFMLGSAIVRHLKRIKLWGKSGMGNYILFWHSGSLSLYLQLLFAFRLPHI